MKLSAAVHLTVTVDAARDNNNNNSEDDTLSDTVIDFGADPTGVSDSTSAFQDAIDLGDVLIPAGTYRVGMVTYEGTASRRIVALEPATIVQTDDYGVFELRGGWDALGAVSSYATVTNAQLVTPGETTSSATVSHVTRLTMGTNVTVAVGDIVKVVSSDRMPTGRTTDWRQGEYAMVGVATTASTAVTLNSTLIDSHVTDVRLARLWDTRFEVRGPLVFDTDPGIRDDSVFGAVVHLMAARDCFIGDGVEFRNSLGRAVGNYTYGARIEGVKFKNLANRPSLQHYGYGVQDGGWMTRMHGCWGENLRHLYSEGTTTVGATGPDYEFFGGGWFAHVSDCVAFACQGQAFDTHGSAYGVTFSDCKAIGAFVGASSGGGGFTARGRNITFNNCTVERSFNGFGLFADGTVAYNCRARDIRYSALDIGEDSGDAVLVTALKKIRVVGGEYETDSGGYYTAWVGASTGYTVNAELSDVRFRKKGAPGSGARMIQVEARATLRVDDVVLDWEQYAGTHAVSAFTLSDSSSSVTGRRLLNLGGSAPITSFNGFNPSGTGSAAPIDMRGIEHRHASVVMTVFHSSLTAHRGSYRQEYGSSQWWQHESSCDLDWTATASGTLPIGWVADPVVTMQLIGSAGAISLAAIPTANKFTGQLLNVYNSTNGVVTLNAVAIPVGGSASWAYSTGTWRRIT